jgi:pimeloyl-ACP methyl ester carboxylesterase
METHKIDVPGATIYYDVRGSGPVLLMIASPMDATGFGTLAGYFPDRTVVTYDPRGAGRSALANPTGTSTPDDHADDLHRVITALDAGPVDVFASSGGAVNSLALVATHPGDVRTLVAHEPPASQEVPDRENLLAVCHDIQQTYQKSGYGPAMAKFIALVAYQGPVPDDYLDQPAPDPAMFGLPAEDDGSRSDPLVGQNIVSCNEYRHNFAALRAAPTRIVIGIGAKTGEALPRRTGVAVAERLGLTPVEFPGDHGGFLGGEYGMTGEPDGFAAKLREVLG